VPDLATGWSWNEKDALTLPLRKRQMARRQAVHRRDVECTWTLARKVERQARVNSLKSWYRNLEEVTTNGDTRSHSSERRSGVLDASPSGSRRSILPRAAREMRAIVGTVLQICRVQAERVDQGDAKRGLLEARPALSRRHRIYDHPQSVDGNIAFISASST